MHKVSKYGIPDIERVSRNIFYIGLILGALAILARGLLLVFHIDLRRTLPPCTLHSLLGLYCPGCGGTRACYALLEGRLLDSVRAHPLVLYLTVGYLVYMLSHLLDIITRGKIRGCYFCPYYWYIGIAVLLLQFVAKNILLFAGWDVVGGL